MSDKEEVSCELSSTTPEDFHPFTWIPGREAGLKKLAAPPKWGVARSFHFNSVSDPTETDREHLLSILSSWWWRQTHYVHNTSHWKLATHVQRKGSIELQRMSISTVIQQCNVHFKFIPYNRTRTLADVYIHTYV